MSERAAGARGRPTESTRRAAEAGRARAAARNARASSQIDARRMRGRGGRDAATAERAERGAAQNARARLPPTCPPAPRRATLRLHRRRDAPLAASARSAVTTRRAAPTGGTGRVSRSGGGRRGGLAAAAARRARDAPAGASAPRHPPQRQRGPRRPWLLRRRLLLPRAWKTFGPAATSAATRLCRTHGNQTCYATSTTTRAATVRASIRCARCGGSEAVMLSARVWRLRATRDARPARLAAGRRPLPL